MFGFTHSTQKHIGVSQQCHKNKDKWNNKKEYAKFSVRKQIIIYLHKPMKMYDILYEFFYKEVQLKHF